MPNLRWLLALVSRVHGFLYRASDGRVGERLGRGRRMLLLATRGRRSGRERETPLLYVRDGERFVVVGSNAGDDRHPAWWLNLRSHPEARVRVGRERFAVRARAADPPERERLWERLVEAYPPYQDYRRRTRREIPVVILERVGEGSRA
jgi:deazaflavin-dependent oxidoreductase (nitroreductase family)